MKTFALCLSILLSWMSVLAQQPARIIIDTEGDVHPWNNLDVNNGAETFQFAIVSDRTGGVRPGVFPVAVEKLNLLQPEFVMSVGDLISGYTDDAARIDREWDEFVGFIDQLTMPFFYVPGNHDYINDVMAEKWHERFGKDYYHFVYKDVLFLCLNTEELKRGASRGYIDQPQYDYIKQTLADNQEVKWTLVFMHQPLWDQDAETGMWSEVEELLQDRKHTIYVGHRHRYVKYERNKSNYFILATTGGGSGLRGPAFGEFDHVVWITMTDDGPIMANLLLDGIWDENVRTEAMLEQQQVLFGNQLLEIEPIITDEPQFTGGVWTFKLNNPTDVPMAVEIELSSNERLWVPMEAIEDTVPPNSVESFEIPLLSPVGVPTDELEPVKAEIEYTLGIEGQPELQIEQEMNLAPIVFHSFSDKPDGLQIDGDLSEWGELSYVVESPFVEANPFAHSGKEDASFSYDICYDDSMVYVAVEVLDDEVYFTESADLFGQDAVGLLFDARPMSQIASGIEGRPFRDWLILGVVPNEAGEAELFQGDRMPPGIQVGSQRIEGGYRVEAAMPAALLNPFQGGDWGYFRFNIGLRDIDLEGSHESILYMTQPWGEDTNIVGSGMFKK